MTDRTNRNAPFLFAALSRMSFLEASETCESGESRRFGESPNSRPSLRPSSKLRRCRIQRWTRPELGTAVTADIPWKAGPTQRAVCANYGAFPTGGATCPTR